MRHPNFYIIGKNYFSSLLPYHLFCYSCLTRVRNQQNISKMQNKTMDSFIPSLWLAVSTLEARNSKQDHPWWWPWFAPVMQSVQCGLVMFCTQPIKIQCGIPASNEMHSYIFFCCNYVLMLYFAGSWLWYHMNGKINCIFGKLDSCSLHWYKIWCEAVMFDYTFYSLKFC